MNWKNLLIDEKGVILAAVMQWIVWNKVKSLGLGVKWTNRVHHLKGWSRPWPPSAPETTEQHMARSPNTLSVNSCNRTFRIFCSPSRFNLPKRSRPYYVFWSSGAAPFRITRCALRCNLPISAIYIFLSANGITNTHNAKQFLLLLIATLQFELEIHFRKIFVLMWLDCKIRFR